MPSKVQELQFFRKDAAATTTTTTTTTTTSPPSPTRTRRIKTLTSKVELSSTTLLPKRPRAPSDPFLDAPPPPPSSNGASSHYGDGSTTAAGPDEPPTSPGGIVTSRETLFPAVSLDGTAFDDDDDDDEYLRVWLSPDLANPELLQLVKLFPSFITRLQLPRFQLSDSRQRQRQRDVERGGGGGAGGGGGSGGTKPGTICFGTGTMWVCSIQRGDGWQGGWWARFAMWWRRVFC